MQPFRVVTIGPGKDRSAGAGPIVESVAVYEFSFERREKVFTFQVRNTTADVLEFEFVIPNANYELSNLVFNGSGQGAELDQVANAAGLFDITVSGVLLAFQSVGGQQPNGFFGAITPTSDLPETRCSSNG